MSSGVGGGRGRLSYYMTLLPQKFVHFTKVVLAVEFQTKFDRIAN
jgi:hypothetical protein